MTITVVYSKNIVERKLMCDNCKRKLTQIEYRIEINEEYVLSYCPNCVATMIIENTLKIPNGNYDSEISHAKNAVKINCGARDNIGYFLSPDEAVRFLNHGLMPREFDALCQTHNIYEFDLHDDFYENGLAWQPTNKQMYINDLKDYIAKNNLDSNEKRRLQKHIHFF